MVKKNEFLLIDKRLCDNSINLSNLLQLNKNRCEVKKTDMELRDRTRHYQPSIPKTVFYILKQYATKCKASIIVDIKQSIVWECF